MKVSIHAPLLQRGELADDIDKISTQVSIHAPLLQRGERLVLLLESSEEYVSIHAPLLQRGEQPRTRIAQRMQTFQSTPHFFSGANQTLCATRLTATSFNP